MKIFISLLGLFFKKATNMIHNFFLDECKTDVSEGIDINKSHKSKECVICHY